MALVLCTFAALDLSAYRTHITNHNFKPHIINEIPKISMADLPTNFWWGNVSGINYLTIQKNQHIPIYCGSCWAFSASSSLSDRIKIKRKAQWPDVLISPQVIISC
jgi:cathepsin X